ncbi:ABC transporter ATP-binding protein [Variovorax sp. J31P207]|uniref:ABC transporter ATP-binding protein n=1 Tax=Variovorax sp. J31P207 TaxID=3053510 RepID=UPI00257690D0|nr:ABC transporter ATP-binding protein [Variovorax sp. J31P207]MDM0071499.1 ABC transporter ATP-binding protein [Variovorax sp. J31P207]
MENHSKPAMLKVRGLNAWYGESHVLHGIDFDVAQGEVVTLLGRNGAGRTTTLRAILGMTDRRAGIVEIGGRDAMAEADHRVAHLGIGYCPEERGIFAGLSTEENLTLLPRIRDGGMHLDDIYRMFPNLKERARSPASRLSGGEQQMLALARILLTGARLLLLDEITEGLAPVIVDRLADVIVDLRAKGYTIVLVEQNFTFAAPLADRHYVIEGGRVIEVIQRAELDEKQELLGSLLAV